MGLSESLEGGCACGALRYRLTDTPMFVHCCHCIDCQRFSGSAFAVNAVIEREHVELFAGAPRTTVTPTSTGGRQSVLRCADCGVALWCHHPELGERIALVYTGTLDRPGALAPQAHCFTRSKRPWVAIPVGVPAAQAHYDLRACWPPESLARLAAARGSGASA